MFLAMVFVEHVLTTMRPCLAGRGRARQDLQWVKGPCKVKTKT